MCATTRVSESVPNGSCATIEEMPRRLARDCCLQTNPDKPRGTTGCVLPADRDQPTNNC
ncbi:MAG: hypothetical protein J07HR59_01176 [Halorubrum sp. J07HR59]|nr:MAG: hypothetical protein J07HR59_01176 [Halorubrum sp. J07HR59]